MNLILIAFCVFGCWISVNCNEQCGSYSWRCNDGKCIDSSDLCDGVINCLDKSDESVENCISNQCPKYAYRCLYGGCVQLNAECNGKNECADKSDEMTAKCPKNPQTSQTGCKKYEFKCDSQECMPTDVLCDGKIDCRDGSDENIEHCAAISCPSYAFRCGYGGCVSGKAKCDGKEDCADASDENYKLCNYTKPVKPDTKPTTTTQAPDIIDIPPGSCRVTDIPSNGDVFFAYDLETKLKYGASAPNFGQIVYKCIMNHILIGQQNNLCLNGAWTGKPPQCNAYCDPKYINGVTVTPTCYYKVNGTDHSARCTDPARPGTVGIISCARGYERPGVIQQIVTCGEDGRWSPVPYRCSQICGQESPEATPYIVGGIVTNITKVPWHVGIYKKEEENGVYQQWCGGTIVNSKVVISAMHCFWDRSEDKPYPASQYSVAAGKFKREYSAAEDLKAQFFAVERIHYPEGYYDIAGLYASDIVLVILNSYIEFKTYIVPICMPYGLKYEDQLVPSDWIGRVAGWGLEESSGKPSPVLKVIELPVVTREQCKRTSTQEFIPYITNDKFCAGYLTGVSVCQGDSGGGLVFPMTAGGKTTYYLRGIVSTGANKANSCDNDKYTTFLNVAFYTDFIQQYDVQYQPK